MGVGIEWRQDDTEEHWLAKKPTALKSLCSGCNQIKVRPIEG